MSTPQERAGPGQARLLASGSLVQQAAQVMGLLAMFVIITVLARRLSLSELGVYGILTSLAGYLLVAQNAAAGAAVRNMSAARNAGERDAAFSTALALYVAAGAASGLLLAVVGLGLTMAVDLPADVGDQAQLGALALGLVTAVGWPATIFRDALRAQQLFVRAAVTEIAAVLSYLALVVALVYADAGLWLVIAASGGLPLLVGLGSVGVARAARTPYAFRRRGVTRAAAGELLALGGYLSLTEAASAAIYVVNRALLGLFRSAATVGLYEGPIRAHNLVRALNAAVSVTVLPSASRYFASSDPRRLRELLLRGSRYTLALAVPLAVTGMALSSPILAVWLGEDFREAGPAMAILMSHWVVNGCSGLLMATLVGVGRARDVARYAWAVALGNVALALILTPVAGLEGVALATALPYLALFPLLLRMALAAVPVELDDVVRRSFLPAWSLGAALAAALVLLRLAADPETVPAVAGAAAAGIAGYWIAYYLLWLRHEERTLVKAVATGFLPRRRAASREARPNA